MLGSILDDLIDFLWRVDIGQKPIPLIPQPVQEAYHAFKSLY